MTKLIGVTYGLLCVSVACSCQNAFVHLSGGVSSRNSLSETSYAATIAIGGLKQLPPSNHLKPDYVGVRLSSGFINSEVLVSNGPDVYDSDLIPITIDGSAGYDLSNRYFAEVGLGGGVMYNSNRVAERPAQFGVKISAAIRYLIQTDSKGDLLLQIYSTYYPIGFEYSILRTPVLERIFSSTVELGLLKTFNIGSSSKSSRPSRAPAR